MEPLDAEAEYWRGRLAEYFKPPFCGSNQIFWLLPMVRTREDAKRIFMQWIGGNDCIGWTDMFGDDPVEPTAYRSTQNPS